MLTRLACPLLLAAATPTWAAPADREQPVKVTAKAGKADARGEQAVTVTLEIAPGYELFANPPGNEDIRGLEFVVTVAGKIKPRWVKVEYPAGELVRDKLVGDYRVYRGKVVIRATVRRAEGDAGPLEVTAKVQAFSAAGCRRPRYIKVVIP